MAKKYYEIGLMKQASPAEHDYETIDWEDDYDNVADARKQAKKLSKQCPFTHCGCEVVAVQITCHSDEEDISSYYLHWSETYVDGVMVRRIDY